MKWCVAVLSHREENGVGGDAPSGAAPSPLLPAAFLLRKRPRPNSHPFIPSVYNDGAPLRGQGDSGRSAMTSSLIQSHLIVSEASLKTQASLICPHISTANHKAPSVLPSDECEGPQRKSYHPSRQSTRRYSPTQLSPRTEE